MLTRDLAVKLNKYLKLFLIVAIIGPRQSGKTTFAQMKLKKQKLFLDNGNVSPANNIYVVSIKCFITTID